MSRWGDLAQWVGPTDNCGDGDQYDTEPGDKMAEHRGLVVHIAEGYYGGTISWQRNPDAQVSSHFIVGRSGQVAQMVDTDTRAWAQRSGNARWLSVECEGFTSGHPLHRPGWEALSAYQVEAVARLLARAHRDYGVPFTLAENPDGRGLGYHSMGYPDWGHRDCPGAPIIGQRGDILGRARAIAGVPDPTPARPAPVPTDWTKGLVMALPTLRRGSAGVAVRRLQALANVAGARLTEDGQYGPATENAVEAFQRVNHLSVDGIAGRQTWTRLLGE